MTPDDPAPPAGGRQRLIEAALRLAARDGLALNSLGLRELAREAGLNHNTFYRHFSGFNELCAAAAESVVAQIMAGMKQVRLSAARHADATVGAADYFLDFARDHPETIVVGLRELHCRESPMRPAMKGALDEVAAQSVEQIAGMNLAPGIPPESLLQACSAIAYYMFYRGLDYLEQPRQRRAIRDDIVDFARSQFLGRMGLSSEDDGGKKDLF